MGLGFGAVTAKTHHASTRARATRSRTSCAGRARGGAGARQLQRLPESRAGRLSRRRSAALPHRVPLIVSVAGESVEDYVALVRGLAPLGDLVEINISSPNTELVYAWNERPAELRALLEAVRARLAAAAHRQALARLRGGQRARHHPRRARGRRAHRELRQHAAGRGAAALAARGRALRARALPRDARPTCGARASASATRWRSSPPAASTRPTRRWRSSPKARRAVGYFTGFITRGPILARQILERLLATPMSSPGSCSQVVHLSTIYPQTTKFARSDAVSRAGRSKLTHPFVHGRCTRKVSRDATRVEPRRARRRAHLTRRNEALTLKSRRS